MIEKTLFFNYSLDCELPRNTPYTGGIEREPFFHGPKTWEFGEAAVCGFVRQMEELGARAGTSLFVYPDVARQPLDLRVETPPDKLGSNREKLRAVIAEHLVEMEHRQVPVRTLIGVSHNTNPFGQSETFQAQNLDWVMRFAAIRTEADRVGSY